MIRQGSDSRPLPPAAALAVAAAGVAAMFASAFALSRLALSLRSQIALGTLLLALPALVALAAAPPARRAAVGRTLLDRRLLALSAALGATLWVGSIGLMEMQSLLFPPPAQYIEMFRALHHALHPTGAFDAIVSLLVIALLPGVGEELVVRGVLLPSLVRPLGQGGAVAVSAVAFATMHGDFYRFAFTLAIGVVFGFVRVRTASLWPSVLAHVTLNGLTFLIAPLVDDPSRPYTPEPALGAGCLLVGLALSWPLLSALARPASTASNR